MERKCWGFEVSPDSNDRLLYLRADESHHRLAVWADGKDDVFNIGWRVADPAALERRAPHLKMSGSPLLVERVKRRLTGMCWSSFTSFVLIRMSNGVGVWP